MALTGDIMASYRRPGSVLARRLAAPEGRGEARALITVMLACLLIFVAQWPRLSREAYVEGRELDMLMGGALLGWVFIAPLFLYALAAISHLVARAFGGRAGWLEARMALFWALLAASPLWLLWGLVAGFVGPGPALDITGVLALAAFLAIWIAGLRSVEGRSMNVLSLPELLRTAGQTLRAPRPTFARLLRLGLPVDALWTALALTVVASMIFGEIVRLVIGEGPAPEGGNELVLSPSPIMLGLAQFAVLALSVFLVDRIGRKMGGHGDFAGAVLLVTWLQFVLTCLQVVQALVILISPGLGVLLFVAGLVVFFWLLTCFTAELHGFESLGRVFGMVLFVMVGFALGLSVLLTLLGVTVPR